MSTSNSSLPAKRAGALRTRIILVATALALAVVPAGVAHAAKLISKSTAESLATEWVADHYADTHESDLSVICRPYGRRGAAAGYVYRAWTCTWYDASDATTGRIRIIGHNGRGMYEGYVINGAQ